MGMTAEENKRFRKMEGNVGHVKNRCITLEERCESLSKRVSQLEQESMYQFLRRRLFKNGWR